MKILRNVIVPVLLLSFQALGAMETKAAKPHNFGWLIEGQLCGLARPTSQADLKYLEDNNVGLVVTLTQEKKPTFYDALYVGRKLERLYLPVKDFNIPKFAQVDQFIAAADKMISEKKTVAVHCEGGIGRTGLMLACYLAIKENKDAQTAIGEVRAKRPGSAETQKQERCVAAYLAYRKGLVGDDAKAAAPAALLGSKRLGAMKTGTKKPKNFGWVIKGQLCGLARPMFPANLKYLEDNNVGLVVTLTQEKEPAFYDALYVGRKLERLYLPVKDFTIPTFAQVDQFIAAADKMIGKKKAVAVHCEGGIGRTGLMLACYLAIKENKDAKKAIGAVRGKRPGSVETPEQEKFVTNYLAYRKAFIRRCLHNLTSRKALLLYVLAVASAGYAYGDQKVLDNSDWIGAKIPTILWQGASVIGSSIASTYNAWGPEWLPGTASAHAKDVRLAALTLCQESAGRVYAESTWLWKIVTNIAEAEYLTEACKSI